MVPVRFDVETSLVRHGAALRALAIELVRGAADVDDAVQETWLRAMRRPPADGGTGGWFATILKNVVRRSRRDHVRRGRREAAVAREGAGPDPAHGVAHEETTRRLLAAIETLEAATRDVVWRRFFEGQPPREIAAARGEPVATVKSRLQRGIKELRVRLGEDGRGDWRAAFTSAFGIGKPGAAASALTGGVLMATWTKVAGAAAVAALVFTVWWPGRDVPANGLPTTGEVAALAPASSNGTSPEAPVGSGEGATLAASSVREAARVAPVAATTRTSLVRGRAVDAVTSEPLTDVDVRVDSADGIGGPVATTGRDGVFEFAVPADKNTTLRLRRSDRRTETCSGWFLRAGDTWQIGDVRMVPGRIVRGRVVDEAGGAIPERTLVTCRGTVVQARTDARGSFVTEEPVGFGPATWEIPFGPFDLVAPVEVDIGPDAPGEVLLRVRARAHVRGIVVDERGKPVSGVSLSDQPGLGSVTSGEDGTFVLLCRRAGTNAVTIHVPNAPECEPREPIADVPWGTDGVRIELRRLRPFTIEVVDTDGDPVEAFGVAIERPGSMPMNGNVSQRGAHAGGRVECTEVVRCRTTLRVLPVDRAFEPTEPVEIGNIDSLRVVLQRRVSARLLVQEGGAAVAGVRVQLLRVRGTPRLFDPLAVMRGKSPRAAFASVPDPTNDKRVWMRGDGAELVDEGVTDETGMVVLRRGHDDRLLRLQAPGRPFHLVRGIVWPDGEEALPVALVRHGSIAGRVVLNGVDPRSLCIEVPAENRTGGVAVGVAGSGEFDVPDLEPGNYELVLKRRGTGGATLATRRVDVAAGEIARVALTTDELPLVAWDGVLVGDGALPERLAVDLFRDANGVLEVAGQAAIGSDRTFRVADLLPGSYRVGFRTVGASAAAPPALAAYVVEVGRAGTACTSIAFVPRRLVVRLVRMDGRAVRGARVLVRCGGTTWPQSRLFSPLVDETLVLDPAPELAVQFSDWTESAPWSEPVQMPADRTEAEVTVVLPDPPK